MKTIQAMSMAAGCLAGVLAVNALAADPAVTDVTVRQRWPWNRLVDIDYVLSCDDTRDMAVAVKAYDGTTLLTLPERSFSGDLDGVTRGNRRIVWDPLKTAYTNDSLTRFHVELTPTPLPLYMIIDLTQSAGTTNQIGYVYEADLTNGLWGSWERNPVTNETGEALVESVIWTGVTTNDIYKTDKLVLRRAPAGTFTMGKNASTKSVTLTKGFYAGVFEVTQAQWGKIMTGVSGTGVVPKNAVDYNGIRGATTNVPPVNWYTTGSAVGAVSLLGVLRDKTGIGGFDLPTEAQWEYACRAGTTSYYNDGLSTSYDNNNTNILNELGWWTGNSGNATHPVGQKRPNAWGLYDTHGNVWEWCLDWYASALGGTADDPAGAESGTDRVIRGGDRRAAASTCGSADRSWTGPSLPNSGGGFRIIRNMP